MQFSSFAVSFLLAVGSAAAFSRPAFVNTGVATRNQVGSGAVETTSQQTWHSMSCNCGCAKTALFSTAEAETEEEVPAEVEALDGIASAEEAHNAERPARESLAKKKKAPGKSLDEFEIGSNVDGRVKTITSYGAFIDIGAETDGLLHISQLSQGFVSDVNELLKVGQEVDVRIVNIDKKKSQIGLSLLTEEEAAQEQPRRERQQRGGGGGRRDDSKVSAALAEKGWDAEQFIEGTVVSTVDFGCFVRIDASQLNAEVEGEMDGLVHISSLTAGRVNNVGDVVNQNDKVQVRIKSIDGRKVSLSMISLEDEKAKAPAGPPSEGAKDWKESLEKFKAKSPKFSNKPMVVDLRK